MGSTSFTEASLLGRIVAGRTVRLTAPEQMARTGKHQGHPGCPCVYSAPVPQRNKAGCNGI